MKNAEPPPEPTVDAQAESVEVTGSLARPAAGRSGSMGVGGDASVRHRNLKSAKPAAPHKSEMRKEAPREVPAASYGNGDAKMKAMAQGLMRSDKTIVVEGYGDPNNGGDANRRASDRANIVRNQLIDQGVPPARIKVVTKVAANQPERVRLVAQTPTGEEQKQQQAKQQADLTAQPVGESHFANDMPMTVEKGASAMVSMVRSETDGEVVYLYDAESERGNEHFAFRAVRFMNPTTSTLETGPVTVYGNERFIGEGLTESIPPKASAVVPYALDRQIVVERIDNEDNKISRLVTLQRGVLTAQVQHIRRKKLTVTNRLREPAQVFIRHTTHKGWTIIDGPPTFERIGDAHLFKVDLKPNEVRSIEIAEATPMERTLDLNADITMNMMKVFVDAPEATPELRDQLKKLLVIHKELVDLAQDQDSQRRRLGDYRQRMDELHGQIVTLQAVKTGNDLMAHLKAKMREISDRVQKSTIKLVDQEEKIMLARVRFQDALSELTLPEAGVAAAPTAHKKP